MNAAKIPPSSKNGLPDARRNELTVSRMNEAKIVKISQNSRLVQFGSVTDRQRFSSRRSCVEYPTSDAELDRTRHKSGRARLSRAQARRTIAALPRFKV